MKRLLTLTLMASAAFVANAQMYNKTLRAGDIVEWEGKKYYVGANLIANPSFSLDPASSETGDAIEGWTTKGYSQMTTANFEWQQTGGHDGRACIKGLGNTGADGENSIVTRWTIEPNEKYYFSYWTKGLTSDNQYVPVVSITDMESTAGGQNELMGTDNKNIVHHGKTLLGKNGEDPNETSYGFSKWNADGSWAMTSIMFDSSDPNLGDGLEARFLQYNARWITTAVSFDDFYLSKLYDVETTPRIELLKITSAALIEDGTELVNSLNDEGLYKLMDEVSDLMMEEPMDGATEEEYVAFNDKLDLLLNEVGVAVARIDTLNSLIVDAEKYYNMEEQYPGWDDFDEAYLTVSDFANNGYGSAVEIAESLAYLRKAIRDYLYSQIPSEDTPADYTFLISNPLFDAQGPWYIGSSGGDQRLNTVGERTCWNAWRNTANFDNVAVYQDLTELPNGYYTLSADMLTQSGCIHDQHLLAKSSTATAVSPVMTIDGWGVGLDNTGSMDSYEWENLTTAKVTVVDGKLTIGAIGTGTDVVPSGYSDYRQGWFCVTNFKLHYYGPLSDEDILAAYNAKLTEVQAQADIMHFAGDKAAYEAVIKANAGVTSVDGVAAALAAINEAQVTATASETKYAEVVAGTYAGLQDSIRNAYSEKAAQIVKKAVDLATAEMTAADATYTTMDAMTTKLRYYRDSYVPVFESAENLEVIDAVAKVAMEGTLADEVNALTAVDTIPGTAVLDEHIVIINNAVKVCKVSDLIAAGGTDYTALIVNPTIEGETGWTFNRIEGNTNVGSGQSFDDSSSNYLDSWNGTPGKLRYTAYQTIENIPNGVYELKTMNRASGTVGAEGVYTYAIADNDSVNAVFKAIHQERMNITELGGPYAESGADSIAYVSDSYGSIFAEAYKATNGGIDVEEGTVEADIVETNNGMGRGWFYNTLQIEVKNHTLIIGVTTDSTFTLGYKDTDGNDCVPFSGTWMSCDNFTLTQISAGDNTGWNPATGITGVENEENDAIVVRVENGAIVSNGVIYNLSGVRVANGSKVPAGVYVVRLGNTAKKVLVK